MVSPPILDVRNVSVSFGGLQALKDVSLSVEQGSISGLIGPNGAGKTTLFNCISRFIPLDQGDIVYDGVSVKGLQTHELSAIGISRTFQNIRLLQGMTVLENVRLGHHARLRQSMLGILLNSKQFRREESQSIQDAQNILEFVGLIDMQHERADNLPYGSRRKLEIARAIATGAQLLMFDEPCAGMNTAEKTFLAKLMIDTNIQYQRTILVIEHDMRFVMNICQSITALNQGFRIAHGTPEEIQRNPLVIDAYLGTGRTKPC